MVLGAMALLSTGLTGYSAAALSVLTFFAVAVALHSRLYDSRPPAHLLTRFYVTTAVGGALGGVFCGLVAPLAFDWVYEHPVLVVAAAPCSRYPWRLGSTGRASSWPGACAWPSPRRSS